MRSKGQETPSREEPAGSHPIRSHAHRSSCTNRGPSRAQVSQLASAVDHAVRLDRVRDKSLVVGAALDGWTLIEPLGGGGNADVWRASCSAGEIALKVLKRTKPGEPYDRFRQEVEAFSKLSGDPGIVSMLDHSLPNQISPKHRAWIAFPVLSGIEIALEGRPFESVVDAVRGIADALARVHERGYAHRDIKPANLFFDGANYLVGDFGLVAPPNRSEAGLTRARLGSFGFMPDELFSDAANANGTAVDVYQLAKTLLVLASQNTYPPQGQISSENGLMRYVPLPRVEQIDALLTRCTRLEPTLRPTMQEMHRELDLWLSAPIPPADVGELERTAARFRAANRATLDETRIRQALVDRFDTIVARVDDEICTPIVAALEAAGLQPEESWYHELHQWVERPLYMGSESQITNAARWVTTEFGRMEWPDKIAIGIGLSLSASGGLWVVAHAFSGDLESSATQHLRRNEEEAPIESIAAGMLVDALKTDCLEITRKTLERYSL